MMKFRIALAAVACASLGVAAQSIKPENQLKLRKSAYAVMGYTLGSLEAMANGKVPMSAEDAVHKATLLAELSRVPKDMFGPGSDQGETRAKPEIWQKRADFDKKMDAMTSETARLAQVARSGDVAALKKAVQSVDDACNACHEDYRVKRRG